MGTSFRDPAGRLLNVNGRLFRVVREAGVSDLKAFLASRTWRECLEQGRIVRTETLDDSATRDLLRDGDASGSMVLEHERVPFPSFPYEWPPEMLHAAGELTLDLAVSLLPEGLGLKDATPYNVLFRGTKPVFVDLLSFERRSPGDPIWRACAQFERTFLLPLLVSKRFRLGLDQLLTARRDGLEPEDVYRLCGPIQRLIPPVLSLVSIPTWLAAHHDEDDARIYKSKVLDNHEKARFIVESLFKRLRRVLNRLAPRGGRQSTWSDYLASNLTYSEEQFEAKAEFVREGILEFRPAAVLDIGCNTGHFSAIAARTGSSIVAIDSDPVVVGETWRRARDEQLDILPLVVDVTRPTPAIGWRNRECPGFLDRARGRFDALMMLAVLHHLLVSERVPLDEIIDLASELTRDIVIIEFVGPDDRMFRRITRGREHLHADLTIEVFEAACRRRFDIVRSMHLEGTSRWLYLLRRRAVNANA